MSTEPWAPGQVERYQRALETTWADFEDACFAAVKRTGVQSMASQHAANYMRRARLKREMIEGLLARPMRTAETPDAIRRAVADLHEMRRSLDEL